VLFINIILYKADQVFMKISNIKVLGTTSF